MNGEIFLVHAMNAYEVLRYESTLKREWLTSHPT